MSLNVKDPEAHQLAQATGETLTHVVKEALRERYERIQKRNGASSFPRFGQGPPPGWVEFWRLFRLCAREAHRRAAF